MSSVAHYSPTLKGLLAVRSRAQVRRLLLRWARINGSPRLQSAIAIVVARLEQPDRRCKN